MPFQFGSILAQVSQRELECALFLKLVYRRPISTERVSETSHSDVLGMLGIGVDKKVLQFLDATRRLQLEQHRLRVLSTSLLGGVQENGTLSLKLSHLLGVALNRRVLHQHDQLLSLHISL